MKKVLIIVGTRPEAIKLFPLYKAFRKNQFFEVKILTSGQHSRAMLNPLSEFFNIKIDYAFEFSEEGLTLTAFSSRLMSNLEKILQDFSPDMVIVQGDTSSCMIASLAAFYCHIDVIHVEAGLRTHNRLSPFPEEANRRITSLLATFHFAPTNNALENLKHENVEGLIEVVGNTVVDSLLEAKGRITLNESKYLERFNYLSKFENIILITGHRRENIGENFRQIYSAIIELSFAFPELAFVYPIHPNPSVRKLAKEMLGGERDNIFLIEPLAYDEMIFMMMKCFLVMTDSGGVQEECPSLNKPVLILRETTERPEGVEAGCSILAGVTKEKIISVFTRIYRDNDVYNKMCLANNPYGDGTASARIVNTLERHYVRENI